MFVDRGVSSLNHDKHVLIKRNLEAWVVMVSDAGSFRHWSVPVRLSKKGAHTSVLDRHVSNGNIVYVGHSKVDSQAHWRHHVFHDISYAHINK